MLRCSSLVSLLSLATTVPAQLAGGYTINPTAPTGGSNFASLFDATTALAAQGVAGPVFFFLYDDAGPFTEATPFVTANGTYTPSTAVLVMSSWTGTSSQNRVTFLPAAGETPVLDAAGRGMGVFWGGADYVTLQGLEIKNATFDAVSLYAEATHGVAFDPILDGCRIHDCGGTGVTIYGNSAFPVNTLVQNCTFWRLQLTNVGAFSTTGRFGYITTRRSTNTRIVHNTFLADTGAGSSFCVLGAYPSGTAELPYAEFSNNIVFKTASGTRPIVRIQSPTAAVVLTPPVCDSNCYFDTSNGPFANWGIGGTTIAATLLDWQTNATCDLTSLGVDPQFRDLAGFDFHLTSTSPCLGASTVVANVTTDFDGQSRLSGLDLGADEFSAGTWSRVGTGCPGTGNLSPTLRTTWPFLGNAHYALGFDQLPANGLAVLFGSLGLAATPIPYGAGCTIELDLPSLTSLATVLASPVGNAAVVLPVPANPAFVGFRIGYQALAFDAGAALGLTFSNALDVTFDF